MIEAKLFRDIAKVKQVKAEALEKDYVMNLILDAIARCSETKDKFFFKGGSCIYKCFYHENGTCGQVKVNDRLLPLKRRKEMLKSYLTRARLSADLDLTVHPDMMNEEKLNAAFSAVSAYVKEHHGLQIGDFSFPIYENKNQKIKGRNKRNCRGVLHFKGPLYNDKFNPPALKLDLTADESVVFKPYTRPICHPYKEGEALIANTYTLRDVFAEKFRSLFERYSAHDMFDVVFLADHPDMKDEQRQLGIGLAIIEKLRVKNIPLAMVDGPFSLRVENKELIATKEEFKKAWEKTMAREKGTDLVPFKTAWSDLLKAVKMGRTCVRRAQKEIEQYQKQHPGMDLNTALACLNEQVERGIVRRRLRVKNKAKERA